MKILLPTLAFLLLLLACQSDEQPVQTVDSEIVQLTWSLRKNNFQQEPKGASASFKIDNRSLDSLGCEWEIHFNAYLGRIAKIDPGFEIVPIVGEYFALRPTKEFGGLAPGEQITVNYRSESPTIKLSMAPRGFFLLRNGTLAPLSWQQTDMSAEHTFNDNGLPETKSYQDAAFLYDKYPEDLGPPIWKVIPTPNEVTYLGRGLRLTKYLTDNEAAGKDKADGSVNAPGSRRLHVWYSGVWWSQPLKVFGSWLENFHGVELVTHGEEKPQGPHLELTYERSLEAEAYEIFNMSEELTIVSASDPAGMLYGLATVLQSLTQEDGYLSLPLERVVDRPRFAYRGQHLDAARNFQSKASVLRLLDLMALFKLNKFHFHLSDDEGWRLEIPGLPELTTLGATRGYTKDGKDHLEPAYGSGGSTDDPYGTGHYSRQDFIDILNYAKERQIEVIPEIDLPGHARAAIKAMEAYARRTKDGRYLLSDPADSSKYRSIQDYPDNVIDVCRESSYTFLEKVIQEIELMYAEAELELSVVHTGGDEVPYGVWTGTPSCIDLKKEMGADAEAPEEIKNLFNAYFLNRFQEILSKQEIRTAGWEEVGMKRVATAEDEYRWAVNFENVEQDLLTYVWNSQGENLDLGYRLANAGHEVVLSNVTNFYFDLAYNTDPAEGGLYWGGFVDTYRPWAFAPFDLVKTAPSPWYGTEVISEASLREKTVALTEAGRKNILGIQGQLWSETVRGDAAQEHYLWPKMLGLAERAWSAPAIWETLENLEERRLEMDKDWSVFAHRIGYHALPLLNKYGENGIRYRLPPPGAKIIDAKTQIRTAFPGLPVYGHLVGRQVTLTGLASQPDYTKASRDAEKLLGATGPSPKPAQKLILRTGAGDRRSQSVVVQ